MEHDRSRVEAAVRLLPVVAGTALAVYILFVPHIPVASIRLAGVDLFLRGFSRPRQVFVA